MQTFARFWRDRWQLDLEPAPELAHSDDAVALTGEDPSLVIAYIEDADAIRLDLSGAPGSLWAVAVDTTAAYDEIELGVVEPGEQEISLPYRVDWAIALVPSGQ